MRRGSRQRRGQRCVQTRLTGQDAGLVRISGQALPRSRVLGRTTGASRVYGAGPSACDGSARRLGAIGVRAKSPPAAQDGLTSAGLEAQPRQVVGGRTGVEAPKRGPSGSTEGAISCSEERSGRSDSNARPPEPHFVPGHARIAVSCVQRVTLRPLTTLPCDCLAGTDWGTQVPPVAAGPAWRSGAVRPGRKETRTDEQGPHHPGASHATPSCERPPAARRWRTSSPQLSVDLPTRDERLRVRPLACLEGQARCGAGARARLVGATSP